MQGLLRLAVIAECGRQPVEQLGVSGQGAVSAEVVGRLDDAAAEVIMPQPIGDRTPGQDIGRAGEPIGECGPPASLVVRIGKGKRRRKGRQARERPGADSLARLIDLAAAQDGDRPRGVRLDRVDQVSLGTDWLRYGRSPRSTPAKTACRR